MNEKRKTAHIIPYKIENGMVLVFLQKRASDAFRNPGGFSIWGGGIENSETPELAMLRESKEELGFEPKDFSFLGEYSDDYSDSFYYTVQVRLNFEENTTVMEGDYGKFLSKEEVFNEPRISDNTKKVLSDFFGTNPS